MIDRRSLSLRTHFGGHLPNIGLTTPIRKGIPIKAMEVQSNENAALLKLLKTKSRTKTELLKVSSARRRARQAALDALLAEGKVIRSTSPTIRAAQYVNFLFLS